MKACEMTKSNTINFREGSCQILCCADGDPQLKLDNDGWDVYQKYAGKVATILLVMMLLEPETNLATLLLVTMLIGQETNLLKPISSFSCNFMNAFHWGNNYIIIELTLPSLMPEYIHMS